MSRKNPQGSSITDLISCIPEVMLDGGQPRMWYFPELGAESFKAGEIVCLSGGAGNAIGLTKCVTSGLVSASGYGVVGVAAEDASGVASSFKAVYVATPECIFVANIGHSSTSANAQTAASDLGQLYGLHSISGRTFVDKAKTSVSCTIARVLGFHGQDVVPTFYGRVYFNILDYACQLRINTWNTSSTVDIAT